jgi:hypothetical protein
MEPADKITTSVGRDMVELKLQQRLLKAQLATVEKKSDKLNMVMVKKMMNKTSSMYIGAPRPEDTFSVGAHTVSEYRLPGRTGGAVSLPALGRSSEMAGVHQIGFGHHIDDIRIRHMQRTEGKKEVVKRTKAKDVLEQKLKNKNKKRVLTGSNVPSSMFPNRYARGELPCSIEHGRGGQYLSWVCPLENLDYDYYLPIFFDGLQVDTLPVSFFVRQGIEDLLYAAEGQPARILASLPNLVRPLRNALSKFQVPLLLAVLKVLRQLIAVDPAIGLAFSPYFKQFLQPMNAFLDQTKNTGDGFDYGQRHDNDIGEQVRITLEIMERAGGADAYKFIKFAIPPYQSCRETA